MKRLMEPRGCPAALALGVTLLFTVLNAQFSRAFGQGSLTPPGAPAPTMKTLAQVEPRIAITNTGFLTISQPGSYYLTTNITVNGGAAINITADNVTLDLNGFTLFSSAAVASGSGVLLSGTTLPRSDIQILNGHIRGSVTNTNATFYGGGFMNGIYYSGPQPVNCRVANVSVSGCGQHGIYLGGDPTEVEACTVRTVGGYGIVASRIVRCSAYVCGDVALYAYMASESYGYSVSGSDGIFARAANSCYGTAAGSGIGVHAITAQGCIGFNVGGSGHGVSADSAVNCYGNSSGTGRGLNAENAMNSSGVAVSGVGLKANRNAQNCFGQSTSAAGVQAPTAFGCYGITAGVYPVAAIDADVAQSSYGYSSGDAAGLSALVAENCYGYSATRIGLLVVTAQNCVGECDGKPGTGLQAQVAIGCFGKAPQGTCVGAGIANSCSGDGVFDVGHKYNMP